MIKYISQILHHNNTIRHEWKPETLNKSNGTPSSYNFFGRFSHNDTFSILISHLANLSFTLATFPYKFKLALMSSLPKKHGLPKSVLSNFRPISNLNIIDKILECLAISLLHVFSSHFKISQFLSFTDCLSQISFYQDCFAWTHKWYHGNHWLLKNSQFSLLWICFLRLYIAVAIVDSQLDFCNFLLSPPACQKYSCSNGRPKISVLSHHTCSFWSA